MAQSKQIDLSVVIVNYNVEHFLNLCLDSVFAASKNIAIEVIVVDNASIDSSVKMLHEKHPNVHLIANKNNVGFGKANNQGVKIAKGNYVCILNPDTIVSTSTFDQFIELYKSNDKLGISGPKMIDGSGHFLLESKRGLPTLWAASSKTLGLFKISSFFFGQYYNLRLDENKKGKTDVLVGAFMFMRKSLYDQLKGFDENFFMYGEDIDLSHRSLKLGYTNYYFPEAKSIHFKGESTPKNVFLFGSYLFSGFKRFISSKSEKKNETPINNRLIVTSDDNLFEKLHKNYYPQAIKCHYILEVIQRNMDNLTEIVFDMKCLQWSEVINFMYVHKDRYTYKFISADHEIIVGSSNVLSRGKVIKLKKSKNKPQINIV
jgi:GT2 family glycosyltransferase